MQLIYKCARAAGLGFVALVLLPFVCCASDDSFTGTWVSREGGNYFCLNLTQDDHTLTGYHTSIREGDKYTDAVSAHSLPSITGEVNGPTLIIRFRSGYPGSYAYGHARLTLRGHYLYWQLTDATGEHYLPQNVVLMREEPKP